MSSKTAWPLHESEEANQTRAIEDSRFHDGSVAIISIALDPRPTTSTKKGVVEG